MSCQFTPSTWPIVIYEDEGPATFDCRVHSIQDCWIKNSPGQQSHPIHCVFGRQFLLVRSACRQGIVDFAGADYARSQWNCFPHESVRVTATIPLLVVTTHI